MTRADDIDDAPDVDGLGDLDRLLDHRIRLAVSVLLARHRLMNFRRLKDLLGETDGSLGAHLRKLEDAGYVSADKKFEARKPITWYSLTRAGKKAVQRHVRGLQDLIDGVA